MNVFCDTTLKKRLVCRFKVGIQLYVGLIEIRLFLVISDITGITSMLNLVDKLGIL